MKGAKLETHSANAGEARYPRLFSSFQFGSLRLANRLMVPAMTTNFAEADGSVSESLIDYLAERARGGFGSIVTENIGVDATGRVMPRMVMADHDRFLPGLARLARSVKEAGSVIIGQISHAGRQTRSAITGRPLVAPSPIPCPLNKETPRELTVSDIEELEAAFVAAAERLARAGFDGVEIHGAHGYLVGAFLSGYSNKRQDKYGGSFDNRLRFLLNIVGGIKAALGPDFPLIVRISADEFVEGGLDVQQAIAVAKRLEPEKVDALSVSVGVYESFNRLSMITGEPEGQWLPLAAQVKAGTQLPIIGVGRIKRPQTAEAALEASQIDIAAFGRASIADPYLPQKTRLRAEHEIIPCFGCNICLGRSSRPETLCPLNPIVGRERAALFRRGAVSRRIGIHGGSLSALTAAWAAAACGHDVQLVIGDEPVGGMQAWRAQVPTQEEYAEVIEAALRRALAAGARMVREAKATEQTWRVRRYEPVDRALLSVTANSVSCYDVLAGRVDIDAGERVTVIGGDLASAEAAIVAAARGARATLVSPHDNIAMDAHPGYREIARRTLGRLNADIRLGPAGRAVGPDRRADRIIIGHAAERRAPRHSDWTTPDLSATHWLCDAYEPNRMTQGIYEAFALASGVDPEPAIMHGTGFGGT